MIQNLFQGLLSSLILHTAIVLSRTADAVGAAASVLHQAAAPTALAIANGYQSVRRSRLQSAAALFIPCFLLPMLVLMQPGLLVTVDGQPIGLVKDADAVAAAITQIETRTAGLTGDAFTLNASIELTPRFGAPGSFLLPEETELAVAEAVEGLDTLAVVYVDGEPVALTESEGKAARVLSEIKSQYIESAADTTTFVEDVAVDTVVTAAALAESDEELYAHLTENGAGAPVINVAVTREVTYTEDIPFETVTRENSELSQKTTQTVQSGENGEAEVHAELTLVNGVEQERTIVSRTVLAEATDEIVEVGTKNVGFGTGKLRSPLTSYNWTQKFKYSHRAVDLCAPTGSNVYAADNGRVIVSEYHPSYGNYIIIDHRNGMETLYAHNSKLIAKVGDVVSQGDVIAKVGSTGSSTAPHVHFMVYVNGSAVNPAKYVIF